MILKVQFLLHENQLLAKDNWFCGLRVRVRIRVGGLHRTSGKALYRYFWLNLFKLLPSCKYSTVRPEYLQGRLNHWQAIGRKVDQHWLKIAHPILGELCHLESFLTMHSGPAVCGNKNFVKYIYMKFMLYCDCRWKWRVTIAVIFPI